jgi:hypothetical protein
MEIEKHNKEFYELMPDECPLCGHYRGNDE